MTSEENGFETALRTALSLAPQGRRLVMQPIHQSIYFDEHPALHPNGEWQFISCFRYIEHGEPVPEGWLEPTGLLAEPR